jgi:hypothetical protein
MLLGTAASAPTVHNVTTTGPDSLGATPGHTDADTTDQHARDTQTADAPTLAEALLHAFARTARTPGQEAHTTALNTAQYHAGLAGRQIATIGKAAPETADALEAALTAVNPTMNPAVAIAVLRGRICVAAHTASRHVIADAQATYDQSHTQWNQASRLPKPQLGQAQRDRMRNFGYALTRPWEEADTPRELDLLAHYRLSRLPYAVSRRVHARLVERHPPAFSGTLKQFEGKDVAHWPFASAPGLPRLRADVKAVNDVNLDAANLMDGDAVLVAQALATAVAALTPEARQTAVTLLLDGYTGNIDSLIAACISLDTGRHVTVQAAASVKAPATLRGR